MSDNEKLIDDVRNRGEFENRGWMIETIHRLADALEAAEKAHPPTDDDRTSEEQDEQRHGDRDADHEKQQTDNRAATRRLDVAGSHAKSMAQTPSDGKGPTGPVKQEGAESDG